MSNQDWETPFGIIKSNNYIVKELSKTIPLNNDAHNQEHSIEVQLPFLQYIKQDELEIVPLIVSHDANVKKIAEELYNIKTILKKDFIIIASSDLTHYGNFYGFLPFKENIKENLHKLDKEIIQNILDLDSNSFIKKAESSTVCGTIAVSIMIEYAKLVKAKPELLKYYTSGEITDDYSSSVGYASIILR